MSLIKGYAKIFYLTTWKNSFLLLSLNNIYIYIYIYILYIYTYIFIYIYLYIKFINI